MKLKNAKASVLCALLQKWNAITSVAQIAHRPYQKRFSTLTNVAAGGRGFNR